MIWILIYGLDSSRVVFGYRGVWSCITAFIICLRYQALRGLPARERGRLRPRDVNHTEAIARAHSSTSHSHVLGVVGGAAAAAWNGGCFGWLTLFLRMQLWRRGLGGLAARIQTRVLRSGR